MKDKRVIAVVSAIAVFFLVLFVYSSYTKKNTIPLKLTAQETLQLIGEEEYALSPKAVEELLGGEGAKAVDLRMPNVFALAKLEEGAVNLPFSELLGEESNKLFDEGNPVVLYDQDGTKAREAWLLLTQMGKKNVKMLEGGFDAWQEYKGVGKIESEKSFTNIDAEGLKNFLKENKDVVVLDVRTPEEVADGAIEGNINVDFRSPDFLNKVSQLDKEKTYVVYCRSGNRSVSACHLMALKGLKNLYNLEGGYKSWK
ncbi:rhodanese-like domain-containing protein [Flammeovirgaceae bacterium SG7u.111]|nr:rhodanese-like domain-containing protein [Flammeovirgaceae bacterium SG7u.132]WPO33588.1 rhodanese-like domain-containing protein [Flammeovirgaceae bacterium SG7u.111]